MAETGYTFVNPVYNRNFPDPFVLKYCGEYWGYCTGFRKDGGCFGILRSTNLVNWQEVGSALAPLPGNHPEYWAPEVFYDNGTFYLYYSVGNEENMQIRVATATHPAGPFVDSGRGLTAEKFAIDAHVFEDDDGQRYLFYATDFLDYDYVGTGTVRDRLLDPFTLEGRPVPVVRARYDWHVYDPQRQEKGGVRWHTIEGPFILKRKGRYYEMFSGGNWQNVTYGASYATSPGINSAGEWEQVADGEKTLPILRTLPGKVIGPGHNSVVRGPDNRQLYCVYHRWAPDGSGRVLAIDPLDWAGERMLVIGPSTGPQSWPNLPTIQGFENAGWQFERGRWQAGPGTAAVEAGAGEPALAWCAAPGPYFLAEISLCSAGPGGAYGLGLQAAGREILSFLLKPAEGRVELDRLAPEGRQQAVFKLPAGFNPAAFHLARLEAQAGQVSISLDGCVIRWQGLLERPVEAIALLAGETKAEFAGFSLTEGWEDLFDRGNSPGELGWSPLAGQGSENWRLQAGELVVKAGVAMDMLVKGPPPAAYELVINARLDNTSTPAGGYGFGLNLRPGAVPALLKLVRAGERGWAFQGPEGASMALPAAFDPYNYQQFRFRCQAGRVEVQWEQDRLGVIELSSQAGLIGLAAQDCQAAFDMVRVTALAGPARL